MTAEPSQPASRFLTRFGSPFLVIAVLFLSLVAYQIYLSKLAAQSAATTNAKNLTLVLESKLTADFAAAERTISAMVAEIDPDAMRPEMASRYRPRIIHWLKTRVRDIQSASALGYFDANGDRIYTNVDGEAPVNVADRPLFRQLKRESASATVFSEVTLSRTTGRVSMFVAKPIRDKENAFLGTAVTAIDLTSLHEHFRSIEIGAKGIVALRRLDNGASVVRFPGPVEVDNNPATDLPVRHAILNDGPNGVMDITSRIDGSRRIYGYRRIGAFPLFVAVGIADNDYLAEWRRDSSLLLVGALLFLASLAAVFFWLAVVESQRSRTETKLREIMREQKAILDSRIVGFVKLKQRKFVWATDAFAEKFGYAKEELIGQPTRLLYTSGAAYDEFAKSAYPVVHEGGIFRTETRLVRKDGTLRWYEIAGGMLTPGGDESIWTLVDVTERAQLESRLRESQTMEALGTLSGGVAHDFNNALAAILGNVELARQDVGPGHAALVSLDEIGKASRRAKDLVRQILTFGRRQTLERKAMSLALVVVETARLLRATLPAHVELRVESKADTPAVLADATQVKQVLLNLCSNALQAVQEQESAGVIEVRLAAYTQGEARGELRPGRYARLSVRDNGSGMDEATRSRIFEPFFTTKPTGKGTGLGLSVVHGIVQVHEASIEVASTPGEGSEFLIYFPAVEPPVPASTEPIADPVPVGGKGKHVLYVDDEEAIIFLMTRLLERQGYRVSGYTDPREALAAARANPHRFALAVTDFNMPEMSGLDVAHALKQIRADLPVVLASGYITEELRQAASAAGVSELIYKPNTVEQLCEAVARLAQSAGEAPQCS